MRTPEYPQDAETRAKVLLARQRRKMARSAHAFVRGSTARFYEWVTSDVGRALPAGPPTWICGDCHVGNLGPVADTAGHLGVQIRDLDQTVIGNPAHDLVRLGLSLAMAARGSDLPGVTTARMVEEMTRAYEAGLMGRRPRKRPHTIELVVKEALGRDWRRLLQERVRDATPTIPMGKRFWPLTDKERTAVDALFATEEARRLVTSLELRDDDALVEVMDAAYWVKGCSSLGRLRCAVLVGVGRKRSVKKGRLCPMDVKEAVPPLAPPRVGAHLPAHHGERVVTGARSLSPYLGKRMLATTFLTRPVFVRELLPQDLKVEIDDLSCPEAVEVAGFLAGVVGAAHGRQMSMNDRRAWKNALDAHRTKTIDAPSWLWGSVVDLVARHEAAYLEHCRRFALAPLRN